MESKQVAHVADWKKREVKELAELMKKNTVMIVSVKNLPSAQFQEIKKKIRDRALIKVAKKKLIDFALDHCAIHKLHELVPYVEDSTAILFSDQDAFEIAGILADEKSPAKAKAGEISPEDLEISAGPTDLLPGPDISALSAVGLQPKVENGKITIAKNKILCKKGEVIDAAKASILAKLDIVPFKIGLEPIAAYMQGKVYANIKIDKQKVLEDLIEKYSRTIAFAVSITYVNNETLPLILGKAASHENAIKGLIKEDAPAEEKKEEPKAKVVEEPKEEKPEEKKEEKPSEEPKEETKKESDSN